MAKRDKRTPAGKTRGPAPVPAWLGHAGRWRWLAVTAILVAVLALLYPGAVFRGEVFASGDAVNSDAFTLAGDQALARGHYPLWNPYLFAGMPSFGSLAYARYLYPPSLVLDNLQRHLGFAPMTWMLAHLLFGGLGMAWLLSRWKLPLAALLLGAVAWLMMPKVVAWGVHGHGSKLAAAMYLPWIVGWTWRILDGGGARAVAMTGLLLGLQLLRGHVQISYYTLLAVGWLTVWNAFWPLDAGTAGAARAVRWRRAGLVAVGLAIGFLIGAMLLVPVHGYASISIRGQDTEGGGGVGLDYATGWSLAPSETATFVLPAAAGFGKATYLGAMPFNDYPNYFGILLLVLAVSAWWGGARSFVVAGAVMAVLAVLVSFGDLGFGLYELLYRVLPYFNKFRIPSMILVLVGFVVAVLAARGVAGWGETALPVRRPLVLPGLLGIGGLVLLAGGAGLAETGYQDFLAGLAARSGRNAPQILLDEAWLLHRASLFRIGLVLLAAAAALWYATRQAGFRRHGLAWVLAGLVAIDLAGVDRLIVHPDQGLHDVVRDTSGRARLAAAGAVGRRPPRDTGGETGPAAAELSELVGHDRVFPLGSNGQRNTWMADGIRSLGGYHPAKLAAYEKIRSRLYGQPPAGRLANWLAARVVAFDQPFSTADLDYLAGTGLLLDPVPARDGRPAFYRNRAAVPRARLVTSWRPRAELPGGDGFERFLDAVQAGAIGVADTLTLDVNPQPAPQAAPSPLAEPEWVTDDMDEVVLQTDAPVPAVLVLADMNTPGWRVEVDGAERPLLTADYVLRGVALEAGSHTVRFHYRDAAVARGLMLTLSGGVIVASLLGFSLRRRRSSSAVATGATDD